MKDSAGITICDRCGNAPGWYHSAGDDLCALCVAVDVGRDHASAEGALRQLAAATREAIRIMMPKDTIRQAVEMALAAADDDAIERLAGLPEVHVQLARMDRKAA